MCAGRMLGGPIVCTAKASIDDGDSFKDRSRRKGKRWCVK